MSVTRLVLKSMLTMIAALPVTDARAHLLRYCDPSSSGLSTWRSPVRREQFKDRPVVPHCVGVAMLR
jgi:hypothetical protein